MKGQLLLPYYGLYLFDVKDVIRNESYIIVKTTIFVPLRYENKLVVLVCLVTPIVFFLCLLYLY